MTVHFIGAGPGAPDLLTLRGRDLIAASPVCLYAGSLIPRALLDHCPAGARIVNSAPLTLDEIIALIAEADAAGQDVARLHSGDLSVWSAMGEQIRRGGRSGGGADPAGARPVADPHAHARPGKRHAAARNAGGLRRDGSDAGDPSFDP